eukprot:CAMPEP_0174267300 /NCGR_PEP_ID=MMETSP0439-20130205/33188_1 /TAXON_ID=0 /ORGANISM="Stereomyxa ramosa, Strain Chinc5" /LENGTH=238 /DNA_ID=CAMNT_0015354721 /DNA_START=261 /DNA_END=977 /DNA_ORIENTATION=+
MEQLEEEEETLLLEREQLLKEVEVIKELGFERLLWIPQDLWVEIDKFPCQDNYAKAKTQQVVWLLLQICDQWRQLCSLRAKLEKKLMAEQVEDLKLKIIEVSEEPIKEGDVLKHWALKIQEQERKEVENGNSNLTTESFLQQLHHTSKLCYSSSFIQNYPTSTLVFSSMAKGRCVNVSITQTELKKEEGVDYEYIFHADVNIKDFQSRAKKWIANYKNSTDIFDVLLFIKDVIWRDVY